MKEYNRKKLYLKRALFYGMLLLLLVFTAGSAKKAYEGRRMQEDIAEKRFCVFMSGQIVMGKKTRN